MPEPTVIPLSLALTIHAGTVSTVEVHSSGDTASLILTDEGGRSHLTVLGSLGEVHALIIDADRQLARLAQDGA